MTQAAMPASAPRRRVRDRVSSLAAVTSIVALALVCLLVFLASTVIAASPDEVTIVALSMVMLVVCSIPFLLDRARAPLDRHVLLSLCSLGHAVYFAVPVFTQYFLVSAPTDDMTRLINILPGDIIAGQVVALAAIVALYAGYFYPGTAAAGRALPRPRLDWSHATALSMAFGMVAVGWVLTLASVMGVLPSSFGSGFLGSIASGSYFGVGLLAILAARHRSRPAVVLMWCLVPPAMAIAFLTGSKRFVLSPVMLAALGYYVVNRRIERRWVLLGASLLLVIYPLATFWREVVMVGNQLSMAQVLTNPGRAFSLVSAFLGNVDAREYFEAGIGATTARLDTLGILSVIVRDTPERVPFQGGWTLLHVPISFIPRILWPGKPQIAIGQWITDNYGAGPEIASNTGSSWIGEFYLNFGLPGVVVGMLVMGAYFRFMHEVFFKTMSVPALLSMIVILWCTCTTIEMNLIAPFSGLIFDLGLIVLGHWFIRSQGGAFLPRVDGEGAASARSHAGSLATAPRTAGPSTPSM